MRPAHIFFVTFAPLLVLACGGSSAPDIGDGGTSSNGNQKNGGSSSSSGGNDSVGNSTSGSSGGSSSGGSSSGGGSSSSGATSTTVKRVFVTSITYSGNLGGVAGADEDCATAAAAQTLGGSWKAWISSGSVNAIDRINDVGPWYLVDGVTKVFNNKANLLTTPLFEIDEDETGSPPSWMGLDGLWTGTTDHGTAAGNDCQGWTSNLSGDTATTGTITNDQTWGGSSSGLVECDAAEALICFEQ